MRYKRRLVCLLLVMLAIMTTAMECDRCPPGCQTTVTCVHILKNDSYVYTVDGCNGKGCKFPYEPATVGVSCPINQ